MSVPAIQSKIENQEIPYDLCVDIFRKEVEKNFEQHKEKYYVSNQLPIIEQIAMKHLINHLHDEELNNSNKSWKTTEDVVNTIMAIKEELCEDHSDECCDHKCRTIYERLIAQNNPYHQIQIHPEYNRDGYDILMSSTHTHPSDQEQAANKIFENLNKIFENLKKIKQIGYEFVTLSNIVNATTKQEYLEKAFEQLIRKLPTKEKIKHIWKDLAYEVATKALNYKLSTDKIENHIKLLEITTLENLNPLEEFLSSRKIKDGYFKYLEAVIKSNLITPNYKMKFFQKFIQDIEPLLQNKELSEYHQIALQNCIKNINSNSFVESLPPETKEKYQYIKKEALTNNFTPEQILNIKIENTEINIFEKAKAILDYLPKITTTKKEKLYQKLYKNHRYFLLIKKVYKAFEEFITPTIKKEMREEDEETEGEN